MEDALEEKRRLIREAFARKLRPEAPKDPLKNLGSNGLPGRSYQRPVGGYEGTEGIPKKFLVQQPRMDEERKAKLEAEMKSLAVQRVKNSLDAAKAELEEYQSYMREEASIRSVPPEESKTMRMHQAYLLKKIARWEANLREEEAKEHPTKKINTRLSVAFDALDGKEIDDGYAPMVEFIRRQNALGYYTIDQLILKFSTTRSSIDYRRRAGLITPVTIPGMLMKFYSLKDVARTYGPDSRKAFEKIPRQ